MSNNLLIPLFIIIISIVIIYGIINIKLNKKLNYNIEKFQNNILEDNEEYILLNQYNNRKITSDIANGTWTFLNTTVNSNYTVNNLMSINLIKPINNYLNTLNNENLGSIIYDTHIFNIISFLNSNIIAINNGFPTLQLHIKFINLFNNTEIDKSNYVPNTQQAIVSIFLDESLITKFISYKVFNNIVGAEVYRIIKSKNFLINSPPPIYDFPTYNIILYSYVFPNNYMYFTYSNIPNNSMQQTLNNKYFGQLQFSIQRVFKSPTNNEIITKNSNPILLKCYQNNNTPLNVHILSFNQDKYANNLNSFFKPLATIVYFYKLIDVNTSYDYKNPNMIVMPKNVLKLNNNSNNMFNNNIQFNNLTSVQQNNVSNFDMTLLGRFNSDLETETIIPFEMIYNLL